MEVFRVLVVDDEPGMRLGVERILQNYRISLPEFDDEVGFDITPVSTGTEALELLAAGENDILLLDYKLEDMKGIEILDVISREKIDVLSIMITAYATLDVAITATKNGAFDFLAKPFTPDEVKDVVAKAAKHIFLTRKAKALEEERRQVRFQFISVLAHELKSPLSAIEGYLKIMNDRAAGDDIEKYDKMINRSIVRIGGMRKMIHDLLDLTRLESGQKHREISLINISENIRNAIEGVESAAADRNIKVNAVFADETKFHADPGEMDIIFNNLLTNAVKYNKDSGTIDLIVEGDEEQITIECRDSGVGMTEEETKKLFKEFSRIKNSRTKDIPGSGLGLSILKKLVLLYKGTITVRSEYGKGTTFSITLKNRPGSPKEQSADGITK